MMNKFFAGIFAAFAVGWAAPASAECLIRPIKDDEGKISNFPVIVTVREIPQYEAKGFSLADCKGLNVKEVASRLCELSGLKNQAIQARLEDVLGVSPKAVCASAKLAGEISEVPAVDTSTADPKGTP